MALNPDLYTHTYEFVFDDIFLKGKVEFDTDGKMSFNIEQGAEPLPADCYQYCLDFLNLAKKIYEAKKTLSLIKIKTKRE